MASLSVITAVLLLLGLESLNIATSQVLKGQISCLDCKSNYDFSGNIVLVKCSEAKKVAVATTKIDGTFEIGIPSDSQTSQTCLAKLVGGPKHIYATRKAMVSEIVETKRVHFYTISTPLGFFTVCPLTLADAKCKAGTGFSSSKTVDILLPPEWGFPPVSYYLPFFPIIGIP